MVGSSRKRWAPVWSAVAMSALSGASSVALAEVEIHRHTFVVRTTAQGGTARADGVLGEPWVTQARGTTVAVAPGFRPRRVATEALAVEILAPVGEAAFGTANEVEIRWSLRGGTGEASIDLSYSIDGAASWIAIVSGLEDAGSFTWITPGQPAEAVILRVRARGPSGEALAESDRPFALLDDDAPSLVLGLLENPYLGSFVDLFLVAEEPLVAATVEFTIDGDASPSFRLDEEGKVYWSDLHLDGGIDSLGVRACGADLVGNTSCVLGAIAAVRLDSGDGPRAGELNLRREHATSGADETSPYREHALSSAEGASQHREHAMSNAHESSQHREHALRSADGRLGIRLDTDAVPSGTWLVVLSTMAGSTLRYEVLPKRLAAASLEIALPPELARLGDRVLLRAEGEPLEAWVDPEGGVLYANTSVLGSLTLEPGAPGSSRVLEKGTLSLSVAAPNPFAEETTLSLRIGSRVRVHATVHDVAGRRIATLVDAVLAPGEHALTWTGRNDANHPVPAGTYFFRVITPEREATRKILHVQ